ncbi:MAG: AgmX/PglI C-terminal domain-containing protein [Deltaproteobacteria bacterium]|nr:AgmX/PglI C-terminal domain-containing protein [Deltaproteobacteria bacterium]
MTAAAQASAPRAVPAAREVTQAERQLRCALVWNGTLQYEEQLLAPAPVGFGEGQLFPLPDGVVAEPAVVVLEPAGSGYRLRVSRALGGSVWIAGRRTELDELRGAGGAVELGPDDYGVITLGPVALFFQHVRAAKAPPRQLFDVDAGVVASMGLAFFLCASLFVMFFLAGRLDPPSGDPLELNADLVAEFLVTPPPEDLLQQLTPESGTDVEDPGLRGREETGGRAHEGDEGRVGHENARQENTEIAGEVTDRVATKVRNLGLLGALSGGSEGNAISAALDAPTVSDILGGTGAVSTIIGRGSRGAGLRGTGRGGGGDGPGSLFGAGNVGTGIGAGHGSGVGRGRGGIGARGRERHEVRISVSRGRPRINGYLSPEQINRVVRANQAAIRYCYEVEVQRQPNLRGRVSIAWRIDLAGRVTTARVGSSTLHNARVEGCMVRQIRRWRFPQPDGGQVQVSYPFIFGVQGG